MYFDSFVPEGSWGGGRLPRCGSVRTAAAGGGMVLCFWAIKRSGRRLIGLISWRCLSSLRAACRKGLEVAIPSVQVWSACPQPLRSAVLR